MSRPVNAIELDRIGKIFVRGLCGPHFQALEGINLCVAEGEAVGLLGPNGSGKTTLLKIILGLLAPSVGSCRVLGRPGNCAEVRCAVGYLAEAPEFYPFLTGIELVRFFARLAGLGGAVREDRIREAIARVGMESASTRRVGTYSRGMKQRIGLAQALVTHPRLVILDEPTANLDPEGAADIGEIIQGVRAGGGTILLSSHQLDQVEGLCTRVVFLDRGRLAGSGTMDELARRFNENTLVVESLPEAEHAELRIWLAQRGAGLRAGPVRKQRPLERAYLAATRSGREGGARFP
jgi:ABC-2 type transport system ATP-binding protein